MPQVDTQHGPVRLRTLQPDDAPVLFALVDANRAHLRPWMPWVDPTVGPDDSLGFIERTLREAEEGLCWPAGVWLDGVLCGHVALHERIRRFRLAELGYWIASDRINQGICTRACRALIDVAFASGRLHKVILHADTQNLPSIRVAKRLGFTLEGTLRQHDPNPTQGWRDMHLFGLLADEWRVAESG